MRSTNDHLNLLGIPYVSILIVTYNSGAHILNCLQRLENQTYRNFEIIVIDNSSQDDTVNKVKSQPTKKSALIELAQNIGFAEANNIGAKLARGKWLVFLNPDAFPNSDWLQQLVTATQAYPQYDFFSSCQIQYNSPNLIDSAGDMYCLSGIAKSRYHNRDIRRYGTFDEEVFGACAAAAMCRKEDFIDVGGFDKDFFAYYEDVDLSIRFRLVGKRCLYVSKAVVFHVGSASTERLSDFAVYYSHRNMLWAFLKNIPSPLLYLLLPIQILLHLYFLASYSLKGKGLLIWKAKRDAVYSIPYILRKRRKIQSLRKITSMELLRFITRCFR